MPPKNKNSNNKHNVQQHYSGTVYASLASKNAKVLDYLKNAILYDVLYGGNCFIRHSTFRIPLLCGVDEKHLAEVREACAAAKLSTCFFKTIGLIVLENSVDGDTLWLELEDCGVTDLQRVFYDSAVMCRTNPGRKTPLKGSHPAKIVTRIPICAGSLGRVKVDDVWNRVNARFKDCFGSELETETFKITKLEYEERRGDNMTVTCIDF